MRGEENALKSKAVCGHDGEVVAQLAHGRIEGRGQKRFAEALENSKASKCRPSCTAVTYTLGARATGVVLGDSASTLGGVGAVLPLLGASKTGGSSTQAEQTVDLVHAKQNEWRCPTVTKKILLRIEQMIERRLGARSVARVESSRQSRKGAGQLLA